MTKVERSMDYALAFYALGAYWMVTPLVDITSKMYPANVHNAFWRYIAVGMGIANLGTFLLGFAIVAVVAGMRGNRILLRTLSVVAVLGALSVAGGIGLYALDALQLHAVAAGAAKIGFVHAAPTALTAALFGWLSLVGFAVGTWRAARVKGGQPSMKGAAATGVAVPAYPIITGGLTK